MESSVCTRILSAHRCPAYRPLQQLSAAKPAGVIKSRGGQPIAQHACQKGHKKLLCMQTCTPAQWGAEYQVHLGKGRD